MSARPQSGRFTTLDALRGVAALAVMAYHAVPGGIAGMANGYLAVDLFFAISGFVIAHSYSHHLAGGMAPVTFLKLRLARLWPMLALGALLGIVLHGGHAGMIFLLPNPLSPSLLYPSNPPLWSLLAELTAYCGFALVLWRMPLRALAMVCAAAGLALAAYALGPMAFEDFGADWRTLLPGLARTAYSFIAGMMIWRLRSAAGLVRWQSPLAWLVPTGLVALLVAVPPGDIAASALVLLAIPAIVWIASHIELPRRGAADALGDLSYPLYCIHVPLLASLAGAGLHPALACALLVPLAFGLDRLADRPLRKMLRTMVLTGKRAAA